MTVPLPHECRRLVAALFALLVATAALPVAAADAARYVTGIRTGQLELFREPGGPVASAVPREAFTGRWLVVAGPRDGYLRVDTGNGQLYWVKAMFVQTSRPAAAAEECDVVVSGVEQRSFATRGLGAGCGKR